MKLEYIDINGFGVLVNRNATIEKYYLHDNPISKRKIIFEFESFNNNGTIQPKLNDLVIREHKIEWCFPIIFAEKELNIDVPILPNWRKWEIDNDNKKLYTEEDLRKAIQMAKQAKTYDGLIDMDSFISNGYEDAEPAYTENEIIQSLQKIPKYIVMEINPYDGTPKLVTNTEEKQEGIISEVIY